VTPPVFRSVTTSLLRHEKRQEDLGLVANMKCSRRSLAPADTAPHKLQKPVWDSASLAAEKPARLHRVSSRMRRSLTRMSDRFEEPECSRSPSLSRSASRRSIASTQIPSARSETRPNRRLTLPALTPSVCMDQHQSKWDRLSAGQSSTGRGRLRSKIGRGRASGGHIENSLPSPARDVSTSPMRTPKRRKGVPTIDTSQALSQALDVRHSGALTRTHAPPCLITGFGNGPSPSEHSTPSQPSSARSRLFSATSEAAPSSVASARLARVPKPSEASWATAVYHSEYILTPARLSMVSGSILLIFSHGLNILWGPGS
jgi:hypothetical protein